MISSASLLASNEASEVPTLEPNGSFAFPPEVGGVRVMVSWISKQQGIICDLDLNAFFYDERARYCEKVDASNRRSKDESCLLIKDDDHRTHADYLRIDFNLVSPETSAIVLFLDGGPRNFQFLQSVNMECTRVFAERSFNSFLPKDVDESKRNVPLFQASGRTRKTYKGLCMCVFYKDGWDASTQRAIWVMRVFLEPVYVSSIKDKQDKCTALVVGAVPALEKFRPRLFASIRDICAALSSHALPKLKKKFQRTVEGLHIGQFTEVIFKQLYETHPRIAEDNEAPYVVAMLQEMFQQIDYNGDGSTNWDEFTTFCVQTGLTSTKQGGGEAGFSLEQYVIEYGEEVLQRDHVLSAYRFVAQMRHIPEQRKLLIIPEDADNVLIMDERFHLYTQLYPSKVQVVGAVNKHDLEDKEKGVKTASSAPRVMIYDAVYCSGRDLYAYTASDHSITVCKELSSVNGMKVNFLQHSRFYHNLLHLKLCWSAKHELLCSTASDRVIYGWNIDTGNIVFQISRHSDIITDFIAVDPLDIFITCSMDRRIVLWSAISRRVKGVLLGHRRGVRALSVYENTLLSAGFECEAKTWDLGTKDCVAILKGHRHPIVAAKLMCDKAQSEKEHRAITVDESGEFRLWNIYVRERASEPVPVSTMQIFEMQNPESPLNQFRFLALPYNSRCSSSYYSNLIACSTKLFHFVPEKNTKEFVPPTAFVCHEAGASLITAIGKTILLYDLASGQFEQVFPKISSHDIFAICMDGERGRRMFLGTSIGEIMLVNSINGQVIDKVHFHSKEITCIVQRKGIRTALFSASMDGHLRVYEESNGKVHLQNSMDSLFGEGVGLVTLKLAPSIQALIAVSAGKIWGMLHDTSFKKLLIVHESDVITAVEIIGASRDKHEEDMINAGIPVPTTLKENLLTIAVAMTKSIAIYVLDSQDLRGVKTFELTHEFPIYITDLMAMRTGDMRSINYSSIRTGKAYQSGSQQLVAVSDDGRIVVWNLDGLRAQGEDRFRNHYKAMVKPGRRRGKKVGVEDAPPAKRLNSAGRVPSDAGAGAPAKASAFLTALDQSEEGKAIRAAAALTTSNRGSFTAASSWLESTSKDIFPVAGSSMLGVPGHTGSEPVKKGKRMSVMVPTTEIVRSDTSWAAHSDTIAAITPLQSHGCFVTVSHDGYHRVWNLDAECLGEMILPNISDAMKNGAMCKEPGSQWRFILERIPITKHHVDISTSLIKSLRSRGKVPEQSLTSERSRHLLPFGFKGFRESDDEEPDEAPQDRLRRNVLKSLNEAPKFAEDPPPTRLPTKEEKELLKLAFNASTTSVSLLDSSITSPGLLQAASTFSTAGLNEKSVTTALSSVRRTPTRSTRASQHDMSSLRSSLLFNGDTSVCLSSFGVPSLWYVPGEKDIFGKVVNTIGGGKDLPQTSVAPAFSESSIASLHREGLIDEEGHRILKGIGSKPDRVHVYDRSQPTLLVRSPALSASVQLPALENVRRTEISFGSQKDMYKNAERLLNNKDSMSKNSVRNAVAMARVDASARRIQTMVHLIQPPTHDEVILPSTNNEDDDGPHYRSDETKMQLRLLKSAASVPLEAAMRQRALDKMSIDRWINRMSTAMDTSLDAKTRESYKNKKSKKKEVLSQSAVTALEHKLYLAIRGEYRNRMAMVAKKKQAAAALAAAQASAVSEATPATNDQARPSSPHSINSGHNTGHHTKPDPVGMVSTSFHELVQIDDTEDVDEEFAPAASISAASPGKKHATLTTRMLLPYYKLESVHQFMDIFAKVDENFSGDLDVNEWIRLFTSLNETIPVQEARMIFMKIDKDGDGYLTMRELIPVVFSKASREQQKAIIHYAELELTKKIVTETVPKVSLTDLEFLFEAYDTGNVGFVDIAHVKERVRSLALSEQQLYFFMELISEFADDDMVNLVEFKRLFSPFISNNKRGVGTH